MMTQLIVRLSLPYERCYILTPVTEVKCVAHTMAIDNIRGMKRNHISRVVRGTMRKGEGEVSKDTSELSPAFLEVALKFVYSWHLAAHLQSEALNYDRLEHLQGFVIPRMYWLFQGHTPDGFVACLVTSYIGPSAEGKFYHSPLDYRLDSSTLSESRDPL